jgi:hypothetical protein
MKLRITVGNHQQQGSGTLMRVFDEIDRCGTEDVEALDTNLTLQSTIANTLEQRGYVFSDDEWVYPIR